MLEDVFDLLVDKMGSRHLMTLTLRECRASSEKMERGQYIYVITSNISSDAHPVYVGSTTRGIERIKEHFRNSGCQVLRELLRFNLPYSDNFMANIFRFEGKSISLVRYEYWVIEKLRPYVYTRPYGGTFVLGRVWRRDGIQDPDFVINYRDGIAMKRYGEKAYDYQEWGYASWDFFRDCSRYDENPRVLRLKILSLQTKTQNTPGLAMSGDET